MNGRIIGSPEKVGIEKRGLEQAVEHLERLRREGMHDGAQLFVARHGIPVVDMALGEARPGIPLKTNSIMLWFSATKPLTSVAIAQQVERGKISLDDPVKKYIPEFDDGKETCTAEHGSAPMGDHLRYDPPAPVPGIFDTPRIPYAKLLN